MCSKRLSIKDFEDLHEKLKEGIIEPEDISLQEESQNEIERLKELLAEKDKKIADTQNALVAANNCIQILEDALRDKNNHICDMKARHEEERSVPLKVQRELRDKCKHLEKSNNKLNKLLKLTKKQYAKKIEEYEKEIAALKENK